MLERYILRLFNESILLKSKIYPFQIFFEFNNNKYNLVQPIFRNDNYFVSLINLRFWESKTI